MKKIFFIAITLFAFSQAFSQELKMSAELKPRFEARHGFGTLASPEDDPALFVSQRTRLRFDFATEKYQFLVDVQNVGVWGDVSTLSKSDKNGTSFHQAWGMYHFSPKFAMKLGRQEISYDDQRILGAVDWAQQARSHDALLFKIKPGEKSQLDLGFALNANGETNFGEDYLVNQYKSLQYAWFHTNFSGNLGLSLLFLNNGMPYDKTENNNTKQKTTYSQTIGGRVTYKKDRLSLDGATYFQGGSTPNAAKDMTVDLSAYYLSANANFKLTDIFNLGAGFELLSGNDQDGDADKNNAFNPFYGTNHKFNGWMDYFYVGNHANNVGLFDVYVPFGVTKDKVGLKLIPHFFSANGTILKPGFEKADSYLGTEIDFQFSYKLVKDVMIIAGYSQMFATESMEIIKGGSKDEVNNWGWIMVTFKPTFFKKKFDEPKG
ncbi:alginate export family protein [Lutimonas zeaxanthinifaciens]|uniref:alginate export family protein n=1 Tax=Lutimonas zeaxanthinifaciens TaxID=3060215 RepID=UPI00265CA7E7|nr:alginate export family protein [Lutimonas sp. YSD2104]WKK64623.1 alginate export family protein [Lutimonas sp. YSD2104]